jgi:Deltex C-terminal domain/Ring finger domain
MAENMFQKQAQLRATNSNPTILEVDIGYMYMPVRSVDRVMTDGLLLLNSSSSSSTSDDGHDDTTASILHSYIGTSYATGVYTSNNPYAYHDPRSGQVGVLVARLKGVQGECFMHGGDSLDETTTINVDDDDDDECDSVNVIGDDPRLNVTVLRHSSQCLPLAYFPSSVIEPCNSWAWGNYAMTEIHSELQKLIDEFFNNAQTTSVRVEEPFVVVPPSVPGLREGETRSNSEPNKSETLVYTAPSSLSEEEAEGSGPFLSIASDNQALGDCCICRSTFTGSAKMVALKGCNHRFHLKCIHRSIQHSRKCPLCRVDIEEAIGTMPSGTMIVRYDETGTCDSFSQGCIVIKYSIPRGIQKSYHIYPGLPFHGVDRTAFLPDNAIGKNLLERLKYAFQRGMTFNIAASSPTSSESSLVWGIQHKTKLDGQGAAGFPDPTYFCKVNQELDLMGVPSAATLKTSLPGSRRHRADRDSEARQQQQHLPRAPPIPAGLLQTVEYNAPAMLPPADFFTTVPQPVRKKKLFRLGRRSSSSDPLCGVCCESLTSERAVVELNACGHQFHTSCLQNELGQTKKCPCCEITLHSPQGTMPSGTMSIIFDPDRELGGQLGCVVVRYTIPSGRQKAYHPFPGNAHCSVDKIAYLSGGDTGLNLLLRLRYAFSKGLTFRVSDKQSANDRNQLLWAIPHPDENGSYLSKCNQGLDRLGVPSGEELRGATV